MISIVSTCIALCVIVNQVIGVPIVNDYHIDYIGEVIDVGTDATAAKEFARTTCDLTEPVITHVHGDNQTRCYIEAIEEFYDQSRLKPSWVCSADGYFKPTHSPVSYTVYGVVVSVSCEKVISDRFKGRVMPFREAVVSSDCDVDVNPDDSTMGTYADMIELAVYCCDSGWLNHNNVCDVP
eukprot:m.225756 g.225756  ORF g.225756 m.225756 type:complete len:181 (-) comp33469_c2_seq9:221-763(-)